MFHENSVSLTETDNITITSGPEDTTVTSNASVTAGYSDVFREYLEVNWSELDSSGDPGQAKSNVQEAKGHFIYTVGGDADDSEPTTTLTRVSLYNQSGDAIPDHIDGITDPDLDAWLEDRNAAEALLTASDDDEGDGASTPAVDSSGIPINGYIDPETDYVYDEDGTLVGVLNEEGNVYWPADWPEDYQIHLEAEQERQRILNQGHGAPACSTQIVAGVVGARRGAGLIRTAYNFLAGKNGEAVTPKEADELFPVLRSVGARANKLRNQLAKLANQAAGQTGKKAATALKKMAKKAGLSVESGGKHLRVVDDAGDLITTIPHSPHSQRTIEGIAKEIMRSAGF